MGNSPRVAAPPDREPPVQETGRRFREAEGGDLLPRADPGGNGDDGGKGRSLRSHRRLEPPVRTEQTVDFAVDEKDRCIAREEEIPTATRFVIGKPQEEKRRIVAAPDPVDHIGTGQPLFLTLHPAEPAAQFHQDRREAPLLEMTADRPEKPSARRSRQVGDRNEGGGRGERRKSIRRISRPGHGRGEVDPRQLFHPARLRIRSRRAPAATHPSRRP